MALKIGTGVEDVGCELGWAFGVAVESAGLAQRGKCPVEYSSASS